MFDAVLDPAVRRAPLPPCEQLIALFDQLFAHSESTRLVGGAEEPLYLPADARCDYHRVIFREDYFSSALHEVAHWCIAGAARRRLADYGYWYEADGRSGEQQRAFEAVECKPQALEWMFSRAAGIRFRVSIDNLNGEACDPFGFQLGVWQQVRRFCRDGLPPRAALFRDALATAFGDGEGLRAADFQLSELR